MSAQAPAKGMTSSDPGAQAVSLDTNQPFQPLPRALPQPDPGPWHFESQLGGPRFMQCPRELSELAGWQKKGQQARMARAGGGEDWPSPMLDELGSPKPMQSLLCSPLLSCPPPPVCEWQKQPQEP